MSTTSKPGGDRSDSASILVTVLGLLFILIALWMGDRLTTGDHDGGSSSGSSATASAMLDLN